MPRENSTVRSTTCKHGSSRSSIDITWIATDTYRARGCGQQVNYSCDADTCYAEGAKPVPAQVNVVNVVNQLHYEYHPPH